MSSELDAKTLEALSKIISDDGESLSAEVLAVFDECLKAFEYKGFDPDKIKKAIRQSKMREGTVVELSDERNIQVSGTKGLNIVVSLLLTLFNLRGNNLEAIKDGLEGRNKTTFEAVGLSFGP